MITRFSYKGVEVVVDQKDDEHADIIIEDRVFPCHQVEGPLSMWHCDQAFYAPDTLEALARHLVELWHIFGQRDRLSPERIMQNAGLVPSSGGMAHGGEAGGHGHADEPAKPKSSGARPARRGRRKGADE